MARLRVPADTPPTQGNGLGGRTTWDNGSSNSYALSRRLDFPQRRSGERSLRDRRMVSALPLMTRQDKRDQIFALSPFCPPANSVAAHKTRATRTANSRRDGRLFSMVEARAMTLDVTLDDALESERRLIKFKTAVR